jgi:hypothetical protein
MNGNSSLIGGDKEFTFFQEQDLSKDISLSHKDRTVNSSNAEKDYKE